MSIYTRFGKRLFDVVAASGALVVLSPLLLATGAAVWLEDRGPVFFVSERIGRDGKPFRFYKFRSMPVNAAHMPSAQAKALRVTRVGRVIRRTSIDELPQLWHILRGQMSVVGPRPAIKSQQELVAHRRKNGALACRPGLTGLAQVNSYDGMPETEKAAFDGSYASEVSARNDLRIVFRTFGYLSKPPPTY